LLCCYNTKHNNPYKASHHPFYEKLNKVPDAALKEKGAKFFSAATKFWDPAGEKAVGTK
jgi:hypothetical protein